jgi:hypothetical protein
MGANQSMESTLWIGPAALYYPNFFMIFSRFLLLASAKNYKVALDVLCRELLSLLLLCFATSADD